MKAAKSLVFVSLLVIAAMLLGACAAPAPQTVEKVVTQIVEKEKVVQSTVVVEVEKKVEVVQTQVVEKVVEKQVEVTPTPGPANPYRPDNLFKLADELKASTKELHAAGRRQVRVADQRGCPVLDCGPDRRQPGLDRDQRPDHLHVPHRR